MGANAVGKTRKNSDISDGPPEETSKHEFKTVPTEETRKEDQDRMQQEQIRRNNLPKQNMEYRW